MLKKLIYSPLVALSMTVALLGFSPLSLGNWYQPAPPRK